MLLKKVFDRIVALIFPAPKKNNIEKICSIEFFINNKQEYNFLCNWAEIEGLDTAKFVSKLLFAINSGYFNEEIVKTLFDSAQNEKEKEFIDDVVFTWGILTKEWEGVLDKEKTEKPIIKPSKAFNINDK
jgi:hypothetical protein